MRRVRCLASVLFILLTLALSLTLAAEDALHVRIDQLIEAKADGPLNPPASDAEFLRRAYLDFAGRIPSADEAREFLRDESPDKRTQLIDRLLAADEYARRMTEQFHVVLMERRGEDDEWTKFLRESFAANKPWDQITREMLNPNPDDEATRGAAFFYTKRLEKYGQNPTDYPGLVRDVGRLFLGVDVQCAQCHDHLFIDDYKQVDYQGLFAFVANVSIRSDVQFPAVAESPLMNKIEFVSVFVGNQEMTGPRLPGGAAFEIPEFAKGEEYAVPPDRQKRTPGVPKFSTLKLLAERLPVADNAAFKRNIVNRLWWMMMGRGLVDPLDLHHSDNPPSHPELLNLLADEIAARKFDIKWFLRELALTEMYQRSDLLPDGDVEPAPATYRVAIERPLSAEQITRSVLQATGELSRATADEAKFKEHLERFRTAIANPPREPEVQFNPTVEAALFLSNDELVLSWLQPRDGNLVDRLSKTDSADQIADELYLSVLTRMPTDEERTEVVEYLSQRSDRKSQAISNLAWALIASTEFCVNH